jgi:hypothetical protein
MYVHVEVGRLPLILADRPVCGPDYPEQPENRATASQDEKPAFQDPPQTSSSCIAKLEE